jgi:hypothetical protein
MTCAKCNAATKVAESEGATREGPFTEKHECANGHTGTISGRAEERPKTWEKTGPVFNE